MVAVMQVLNTSSCDCETPVYPFDFQSSERRFARNTHWASDCSSSAFIGSDATSTDCLTRSIPVVKKDSVRAASWVLIISSSLLPIL